SEDTSKQGRISETAYEGFTLQQFTPTKVTQGEEQCQESSKAQLSVLSAAKILADASREKVKTYTRRRITDSSRDSTAGGLFSTAEEVKVRYYKKISNSQKETSISSSSKKEYDDLFEEYDWIQDGSEPIQEQPTEEPKELSEDDGDSSNKDDVMWKLQRYMYDPLTWRMYGTCGVHHVSSTKGHDIYMLIEKDYPLSTAVMNLMLSRRLQVEEDSETAKDLKIDDLEINHKFRGGLLGIKGFYKFILLKGLSTAI
ncbi:hypothetical protein Tco_1232049, partial [Tanacetum coccineum]